MLKVKCTCGTILDPENFSFSNGCNDLGEDIHTAYGSCEQCNERFEWSGWGELESVQEALDSIQMYYGLLEVEE